jgi:hypothetical protein
MNPNTNSCDPKKQKETEWVGELQEFCGPALLPDDKSLEPRERKGRPNKPESADRAQDMAD